MIYEVDGQRFDDIDDVLDYCIEDDYHEDDDGAFKDWVNNEYSGVSINGEYYEAYDIVEALNSYDLDNLREQYCDEMNDSDKGEARWALEHASDGDYVYVQSYTVHVYNDNSGDYDGDEELENLRERLSQDNVAKIEKEKEEKKNENDIMNILQVIK